MDKDSLGSGGSNSNFDAAEYFDKIFAIAAEFFPHLPVWQVRKIATMRFYCNLNNSDCDKERGFQKYILNIIK